MPDKYVGSVPYVVGKPWDRAAIELHEFLRKLNFAHNLQVDLNAASISGGNTLGSLAPISSGTIYFSASNNLTLSQSRNSLGIIGPSLISVGVSTGGNTAGTTGLVASRLVLYGGSNVSLSQSVSGHSATITWNVHPPIGIAAGTQTATTGTIQFANSNGVTFGMSGSNTITASVAAGGGVAISAGTESASSGTVVFSNSNNVSFGMNAGTVTATVTVASTAASITASGSNGSFYSNYINFDLSNTNITVYTTENGFGSGGIAFSARQKYLEAGISTQGNTAGTSGLVYQDIVFVGSNNITLSQSANGTNATLSIIGAAGGAGDGYNIIAAGTQTAGTTGTVVFSNSNNVTFGMSNSSVITAQAYIVASAGTTSNSDTIIRFMDGNGVSFTHNGGNRVGGSVETSYAASNHSHGNPTLALTNLTGTTASASSGLTISLSAAAPGGGGAATLSHFNLMQGEPMIGTSSLTFGISSVLIEPFILPNYVSASYIRIPVSIAFGSTTYATSANNTQTYRQTLTNFFHVYSQGVGASSRSIQSIYSTSMSNVLQIVYLMGAASNNQSCSHAITYNVTGSAGATFSTSYSPAASSIARVSTTHLTAFTGIRYLDIPYATLFTPGNYWAGFQLSSSSGSTGASALQNCSSRASFLVVTQISANILPLGTTGSGSNMWQGFGHGWWTTNSSGATTASINLAQVSTIANQPVLPFHFVRQA